MIAGIGYFALAISMLWLALLSRKLGRVTHAPPYYIGLLVAAILLGLVGVFRLGATLISGVGEVVWAAVNSVLPVLSLIIGVVFAWQYWSWLFAERD